MQALANDLSRYLALALLFLAIVVQIGAAGYGAFYGQARDKADRRGR